MSEEMQPQQAEDSGNIPDILAVIESAKARGGLDALEKHIAKVLPEANESEVRQATEVAAELIDSIPVLLATARQEAHDCGLDSIVCPLLDRAEWYYLHPLDLIPEMTQGLAGLLDDSYLVIRILQHVDRGPESFLDWDLDYPARFIERLVEAPIAEELDRIALEAIGEVSARQSATWQRTAHPA